MVLSLCREGFWVILIGVVGHLSHGTLLFLAYNTRKRNRERERVTVRERWRAGGMVRNILRNKMRQLFTTIIFMRTLTLPKKSRGITMFPLRISTKIVNCTR
jgi:hypothetical protein